MNAPRFVLLLTPLAGLSLAVSACQTASGGDAEVASASSLTPQTDAHALAQAACGGCHSVEPHGLSPNLEAPEFPLIANNRSVTQATLRNWLRNAHNYPDEMDFYLDDDEVDLLAGYILSLRTPDYQPPI